MSLLKPKYYYMSWEIVFIRLLRPKPKAFCCFDKRICKYYSYSGGKLSMGCMGINVKSNYGNTTIYSFCSYLNRNVSFFIYAPQKTI